MRVKLEGILFKEGHEKAGYVLVIAGPWGAITRSVGGKKTIKKRG